MDKSPKFWLFATICFLIFTVVYILRVGFLNPMTILNAVLFLICAISLIVIVNNSNKNIKINPNKKVAKKQVNRSK